MGNFGLLSASCNDCCSVAEHYFVEKYTHLTCTTPNSNIQNPHTNTPHLLYTHRCLYLHTHTHTQTHTHTLTHTQTYIHTEGHSGCAKNISFMDLAEQPRDFVLIMHCMAFYIYAHCRSGIYICSFLEVWNTTALPYGTDGFHFLKMYREMLRRQELGQS